MLKHIFLVMFAIFLIGAADRAGAETMNAEGKVADAFSGEPISNAIVSASLGWQEGYICKSKKTPPEGKDCKGNDIPFFKPVKTKTDKDGHFAYKDMPRKRMVYVAEKPGYLDAAVLPNFVEDSQVSDIVEPGTKNIVRKLVKSAAIKGVIQDHKGVPLEGVPVYFCYSGAGEQMKHCDGRYSQNYITDHEGKFQIKDIAPGKYHIGADPLIRSPIEDDAYIDSYNEYLLLSDGRKVDNSNISTEGYAPARDAGGQAVGYDSIFFPDTGNALNLLPGETKQLTLQFKLVPLRNVSGTIHQPADKDTVFPMSAYVYAYDAVGQKRFQQGHNHSGGDDYDIWLPEGKYTLSASGTDEKIVDVGKNDIKDVDFTLEKDTPVEVTLTAARAKPCKEEDFSCSGEPWLIYFRAARPYGIGEQIEAEREDSEKPMWKATLTPGKYNIEILTTSNAYAKTVTNGTVEMTHEPLVVHAGMKLKPITITLDEGAGVKGRILKNGKAVVGQVHLMPLQRSVMAFNPQTHPDGLFDISGNPPGDYLVFATEAAIYPDASRPESVALWEKKAKRVTLEAGKTLSLDLEVIDPYQ